MTQFTSYDGTKLAFRRAGAGRPLGRLRAGARPGGVSERARAVQAGFYAAGAFDPPAVRAGLARVTAPVMMYIGQAEIGPTPGTRGRGGRALPRLGTHGPA